MCHVCITASKFLEISAFYKDMPFHGPQVPQAAIKNLGRKEKAALNSQQSRRSSGGNRGDLSSKGGNSVSSVKDGTEAPSKWSNIASLAYKIPPHVLEAHNKMKDNLDQQEEQKKIDAQKALDARHGLLLPEQAGKKGGGWGWGKKR
jgi:hypothetical protein